MKDKRKKTKKTKRKSKRKVYSKEITSSLTHPLLRFIIVGCLTTIFQVFLGVQAGEILLCYKDWKDRVVRWLLWAVFLAIVGFLAHVYVIPVNKNLWSLSFALVTTAFALGLLSACYLLVDVARIWRGGPFRIPGR